MQNSIVEKNFKIGCKAEEISPLLEKVFSELVNSVENSSKIIFKLELAAREMLANAIEHGCALATKSSGSLKNLKIKIDLKIGTEKLLFQVEDPGSGFDWENYDLDKMLKLEEKGRGLKMINQVSDQIKFNLAGNKITAIFNL
jgi:serine/threonine-protein kinase RsbW